MDSEIYKLQSSEEPSDMDTVLGWVLAGGGIRRLEIEAFDGKVEIELHAAGGEHWFSGIGELKEMQAIAASAIREGEI